MQEIDVLTEKKIQEGRNNSLDRIKRYDGEMPKYQQERLQKALTFYGQSHTLFNYEENTDTLWLNLSIPELTMVLNEPIFLSTHDKISMLKAINKDNNVVKAGLERVIHEAKNL